MMTRAQLSPTNCAPHGPEQPSNSVTSPPPLVHLTHWIPPTGAASKPETRARRIAETAYLLAKGNGPTRPVVSSSRPVVLSAAGACHSACPLPCSCCSAGGCVASKQPPRARPALQDHRARQRLRWAVPGHHRSVPVDRWRCCICLVRGMLRPRRGLASGRQGQLVECDRHPAGSPAPRPPVRNDHAAGSVRRHARRSRPWRCAPV
jgi:hypothetical protein